MSLRYVRRPTGIYTYRMIVLVICRLITRVGSSFLFVINCSQDIFGTLFDINDP